VLILLLLTARQTGRVNSSQMIPRGQNMLLAARGLGIGAALTAGWAGKRRADIKALLGIPENVEPLGFPSMGYPDKERYGKTSRRPVAEVTHWDQWEGEKPNSATVAHR